MFLQGLQLHVHYANPLQIDRVHIPFELFAAAKSAGRDIYWNIIVASSFLLLLLFLQAQELHASAHNTQHTCPAACVRRRLHQLEHGVRVSNVTRVCGLRIIECHHATQ